VRAIAVAVPVPGLGPLTYAVPDGIPLPCVGARVLVLQADLPPPGDDEFYYHELEGFAVATTDGQALGSIVETFATGANDVWVVRDGRREYLIPVIADVVRSIDRDGRRIVIEPIPGLLE
jgi:16S rRNA processing protein RimM